MKHINLTKPINYIYFLSNRTRTTGPGVKFPHVIIKFLFHADRQSIKGLGTRLFVKVLRSGDSEVTLAVFESSCHLLLTV